jgi:ABC-type multidrug transport system fused ATPase/permease subunit
VSAWIGQQFVVGLRTAFFRHLQGLSLDFFERKRLGDLLARLTGDIASIETFVLSGPVDALAYNERRIGQRGRRLSGGQRQRIAIARAMVRSAPILLLDEPTTGLDAESSQRIVEPLLRLASGRSSIIVSHNLLTVREATRILVLDKGAVVEQGRHAELMRNDDVYARLWRLHEADQAPPVFREMRVPEFAGCYARN